MSEDKPADSLSVTPPLFAQDAPAPIKEVVSQPNPTDAKKDETVMTPAPSVVPEKYELKLPENSNLDAKSLEDVSAYAKQNGLSNKQAQALLERDSVKTSQQTETFKKQTDQWLEDAKVDKEIGGETFNQNVSLAKRVVDRFATESFRKTLNDTRLGNHPELIRVFARIGKLMSEDQLVIPGSQTASVKRSIEEVFYGQTKQAS